jgi:hypothetical protein
LEGLFSAHISHHGVSTTAANTVEKVVTNVTPGFDTEAGGIVMRRGTKVSVVFTHGNTAANPTLRIGASAARPITRLSNWPAGATVEFVLDGQNWHMINPLQTSTITPQMDAAWDSVAVIGTDNGQYANADHVHPANTQQHADHIVAGRLHLDRLPTSDEDNRVLAVGEAGTSPFFQQVIDPMIAHDAVRTHHILDRNVTEPKIGDDAVVTRTIMDRNVTEPKLADDSVSTRTIIDRHVTEPKIGDDAVVTRTIMDRNVTEPKLADDSVSTRTIINQNVTTEKIADLNVTTEKINDLAVTEPKLADDSVSTRTIIDRNVTTEKIAHRNVTGYEMMTSTEDNMLLRVGQAGTDPVFSKANLHTDFEGILPVYRGGTGADTPAGARENLQAAYEVEFRDHVENDNIHVTGRDRDLWEGETFGVFNAHNQTVNVTIAPNKRITLTSSGTCVAHDDSGNRVSTLLRYHPWGQGTGNMNTINFGPGSSTIHGSIGFTAARVGYADAIIHFHGDNTWYNAQFFSRANNSNTGGEAGVSTRLQQVRILVKEMI